MSHAICRRLFESRLAAWAADKGYPVAYQNVPFTPQSGQLYLRAFLLPSGTYNDDLAGEQRRFQGLFQVSVVAPAGQGPGSAESVVTELAALFPLNYSEIVDGLIIQIMSPVEQGPEIPDDTEYTTPASFSYRAETP